MEKTNKKISYDYYFFHLEVPYALSHITRTLFRVTGMSCFQRLFSEVNCRGKISASWALFLSLLQKLT